MTRITAHSGCDGTRPGSIEGLYAALEAGADTLELDLRLYDGEVLLSHDPICEEHLASYVRLKNVVSDLRSTSTHFNCDLKEQMVFAPACRIFRELQMEERLEFTGRYPIEVDDWDAHYIVYQNAEDIPGISDGSTLSDAQVRIIIDWFEEKCSYRHCLAGLNIEITQLEEKSLAAFQAHGIALSCWGVNKTQDILLCLGSNAVKNITTDSVRKAYAIRKSLL